ncbi:MAG: anti-sigma factor antagonist [Clostridia bacterium]
MKVSFKNIGNNLIIKAIGEIDDETAQDLRRKIDVEYDESKAKNMVFDLSEVGFMDSSGIGMIIGRYKRVQALGGQVRIFGADRTVKRIIELSGLGQIVKMYTDEKSATEERRGVR